MVEKNLFLDLVGNSPMTRVLDVLILGRDFEYTLTDMASSSEVGWTTLHRLLPYLLKNEVIVQTRTIGKAKLFKLNQNNPAIKKFVELFDALIKMEIEKIQESQKIKVKARAK